MAALGYGTGSAPACTIGRMDDRRGWRSGTTNRGRAPGTRAYGRRYLAGAFVVLGLLVAHLFLMAHEPHHEQHAAHDTAAITAAIPLALLVAPPDAPAIPHPALDGCPVAQATLPAALLLLLTYLLGTWAGVIPLTTSRARRLLPHVPPEPLAQARRRAFLQIFLI